MEDLALSGKADLLERSEIIQEFPTVAFVKGVGIKPTLNLELYIRSHKQRVVIPRVVNMRAEVYLILGNEMSARQVWCFKSPFKRHDILLNVCSSPFPSVSE